MALLSFPSLLLLLLSLLLWLATARGRAMGSLANIAHLFANGGATLRCPTIKTRTEWGASAPTRPLQPRDAAQATATALRVMPICANACSDANTCPAVLRRLQAAHKQQNWADIAYHFLIAPDGAVFGGRAWNRPGPRSMGSARTLQVAFLGSYARRNINLQEVISLWSLKQCLQQRQRLSENFTVILGPPIPESSCGGGQLFQQFRRWQSAGQLPR